MIWFPENVLHQSQGANLTCYELGAVTELRIGLLVALALRKSLFGGTREWQLEKKTERKEENLLWSRHCYPPMNTTTLRNFVIISAHLDVFDFVVRSEPDPLEDTAFARSQNYAVWGVLTRRFHVFPWSEWNLKDTYTQVPIQNYNLSPCWGMRGYMQPRSARSLYRKCKCIFRNQVKTDYSSDTLRQL